MKLPVRQSVYTIHIPHVYLHVSTQHQTAGVYDEKCLRTVDRAFKQPSISDVTPSWDWSLGTSRDLSCKVPCVFWMLRAVSRAKTDRIVSNVHSHGASVPCAKYHVVFCLRHRITAVTTSDTVSLCNQQRIIYIIAIHQPVCRHWVAHLLLRHKFQTLI